VVDPHPISTERFVADLGDAVAVLGRPVMMVGHSMGALHSWCLAAARPELVKAVVVEDMAPDFRGRTTGPWEPWVHALPVEFASAQEVYDEFGPVAGQYFLEAFDRTATGWRLHGYPQWWLDIAAQWGTRDYWQQWREVKVPTLLMEAENSVAPPGQMRQMAETGQGARYLYVPGAGHLIHDDAPEVYRDAVTGFLTTLA
jgi:pimeloyl-ACP methyl ester carboxylesterase